MSHIKDLLDPEFIVYSGCDEMAFSGLSVGTNGIIGSFYNVMPEILFKKIYAASAAGQSERRCPSAKIGTEIILASIKFDYLALMRNMLAWQGVDADWARRPFRNYKDEELDDYKAEILRAIKEKYSVTEVHFLNNL